MKVEGDLFGAPGLLSFYSPVPEGRDEGLYESAGDSLESPDPTFMFCCPAPEGRDRSFLEKENAL